ncbi:hypothetical protein AB1Y20_014030 [Prymnesium parvum]|uniref:hydroxyacylglutathione hydrolase n=1 Tax=Prymnesium parvum TaxID=97485 RepID=A0AB34IFA3_PRYPA
MRLAVLASAVRLAAASRARLLSSAAFPGVQIEQFPCLRDNYGYLLHDVATGATAAIDTPEVAPILSALSRRGWRLSHVLNTHHHHDHAGGNAELVRLTGCHVVAPAAEAEKIGGVSAAVRGGESFALGALRVDVLDVGGHTLGHVAYHLPDAGVAFVGDALFALGCGRLFEGTAAQAHASLQRLAALPRETVLYCAHEYTLANLAFARAVEPGNAALAARGGEIEKLRAHGLPTVPSTLAVELETNPFLRTGSPLLREHLGISADEADVDVFARLRRMKDAA